MRRVLTISLAVWSTSLVFVTSGQAAVTTYFVDVANDGTIDHTASTASGPGGSSADQRAGVFDHEEMTITVNAGPHASPVQDRLVTSQIVVRSGGMSVVSFFLTVNRPSPNSPNGHDEDPLVATASGKGEGPDHDHFDSPPGQPSNIGAPEEADEILDPADLDLAFLPPTNLPMALDASIDVVDAASTAVTTAVPEAGSLLSWGLCATIGLFIIRRKGQGRCV
jgi:hypothetical protein